MPRFTTIFWGCVVGVFALFAVLVALGPRLAPPISASPSTPPQAMAPTPATLHHAVSRPSGFPGDNSCLQVRELNLSDRSIGGWTENDCKSPVSGEVILQVLGADGYEIVEEHTVFVHDMEPNQWKSFDETLEHGWNAKSVRIASVTAN